MIRLLLIGSMCCSCLVVTAEAQTRGARSATVEVAGGGGLFGGGGLGTSDANLRANSLSAAPYRLFTTTSRFDAAPFLDARVAVGVWRRLSVEGRFGFSRPQLRTSISSDAEQGSSITAVERIDQLMLDGSALFTLEGLRWREIVPFAAGGAGYLRDLHEGRTLIEQGHSYHAGMGIRRRLFVHDRGFVKSGGVRGDARVYLLSGGAGFDTATRARLAVSAAFFAGL